MTAIRIHDLQPCLACNGSGSNTGMPAKLPPLEIGALVVGTFNLLEEAIDLPQPQMITVSDFQYIDLQFPGEPPSFRALARWALRFGGVMTSQPRQTDYGPQTWCRLEFDYYGVAVRAYAHIRAATAT